MSYQIGQSTSAYALMFLMVESADHVTPLTGASPTVTISKNGGAFASPSGSVSEIANGWYKVAGNTTDSATLGPLVLHATAASGDPSDTVYEVVVYSLSTATIANVTTVATTTNLTNAPTSGDFTATMKTSLNAATPASVQNLHATTGDSFARLGAPAGASVSADVAAVKSDTGTTLTDAAAIKAKTDQLAFTTGGHVDAGVRDLNGTALNGNGTSVPWGP